MKTELTITVVTPTYNQADYIGKTLQSVLDQELGDRLQYIIQDACSTDDTKSIIQAYKRQFVAQGVDWHYSRESDAGQSDGINRGWSKATGDVVAFLNSDDIYCPGALQAVLAYFRENPSMQWACGGWRLINESGTVYKTCPPGQYSRTQLLNHCMIGQPAVFLRRSLLDEVGFLDTTLHLAMDYDLWLRISQRYRLGMIPAILADMRYYGAAKSAAQASQQAREIFHLACHYTRTWSWRRVVQWFYYLRGLAVIWLGLDISCRIARQTVSSQADD